jgi:hypothetical protein
MKFPTFLVVMAKYNHAIYPPNRLQGIMDQSYTLNPAKPYSKVNLYS